MCDIWVEYKPFRSLLLVEDGVARDVVVGGVGRLPGQCEEAGAARGVTQFQYFCFFLFCIMNDILYFIK